MRDVGECCLLLLGRMPPSFFLRAVILAEKNRIRAKSLIWPLRKVLTREVRLRIRRFPASAVWLEIRSWRWMGLRPTTPPPLLPENERIASRISWEDVVIEGMFVGIGMISIFYGAGGCLDCRLSSTSGVMLHNMSSDATARTAAATSLTDKWWLTSWRRRLWLSIAEGRRLYEGEWFNCPDWQGMSVDEVIRCRRKLSWIFWAVLEVLWSLPDWVGIPNTSIAKKKSLVHDRGVCNERALLIVSLRALAAWMRHDLGILRITRFVWRV